MAKHKGHKEIMFKGSEWTLFHILPGTHSSKLVNALMASGDVVYWQAEDFLAEHGIDYMIEVSEEFTNHMPNVAPGDATQAMSDWRRDAFAEGFSPNW